MKFVVPIVLAAFFIGSAQAQTQDPHASPPSGTSVVVAGVADAGTGSPIEGAVVELPNAGRFARTNWIGEATLINVPLGKQRIRVRKLGYTASDIDLLIQTDSIGPVFMLERAVTSLDTVFIGGAWHPKRMSEFYAREATHIGRYLSDSVLASEKTQDLAVVLYMRFPGLRLAPDPDNFGHDRLVSSHPQTAGALQSVAAPCPVDIYIDGFRSFEDLRSLTPSDLEGVEYYSIESAPVQYRLNTGACGVVLLWTKY